MTHLKTLTYATMHLVVAVGVAFALTQNWTIALGIGLIEPLVQTVFYAVHERVWLRFMGPRGRARNSGRGRDAAGSPAAA